MSVRRWRATMAEFYPMPQEWHPWIASRPPVIQALWQRCPPNRLYRMAETGQIVYPVAYNEGGTLTVMVSGRFNLVMFERTVFGVSPDDLTECEWPTHDAIVGDLGLSPDGSVRA